jgi:hypothetical protein
MLDGKFVMMTASMLLSGQKATLPMVIVEVWRRQRAADEDVGVAVTELDRLEGGLSCWLFLLYLDIADRTLRDSEERAL